MSRRGQKIFFKKSKILQDVFLGSCTYFKRSAQLKKIKMEKRSTLNCTRAWCVCEDMGGRGIWIGKTWCMGDSKGVNLLIKIIHIYNNN